MRETSVVLGVSDTGLQEEILHFFDLLPGVSVVGAANEKGSVGRLLRQHRPDLIVGAPELLPGVDSAQVLAVDLRETTEGLRTAIRVGARGYYVWPAEREALGSEVQRARPLQQEERNEDGIVVAVLGARGGAGATFLATNLAAAFARVSSPVVLADLDTQYGDVRPALGIAADPELPTISDLASVSSELTAEHLDSALHDHPSGFRVLLAPEAVPEESSLDPVTVAGVVTALRSRFVASVLHLPRAIDGCLRSAVERADQVLLVLTLDVLGIRAAKRLVEHLRSLGLADRVQLVVNRADRGEIVPEDAQEALEVPVACVIGTDRWVGRAQNRGELVIGKRGRLSRRITSLAGTLLERKAA